MFEVNVSVNRNVKFRGEISQFREGSKLEGFDSKVKLTYCEGYGYCKEGSC